MADREIQMKWNQLPFFFVETALMRVNVTRIFAALAACVMLAGNAKADIITQWTFEGGTGVTTPATGSGTASLVGGTTATFAGGNGGSSFAWNTSTYAAQGTGSGTRGVMFMVSTVGYEDITINYDHRSSGTNSRWSQLEYTLDGGGLWTVFGNNNGGLSPHDTFYAQSFDLSSISGADENANFGIRITSIFSPNAFDQNATLADFAGNTAYQRANADSKGPGLGVGSGDYGTSGTWRFDNVTFNGTAVVPEPSTCIIAGIGLIGFVGLARRARRLAKN